MTHVFDLIWGHWTHFWHQFCVSNCFWMLIWGKISQNGTIYAQLEFYGLNMEYQYSFFSIRICMSLLCELHIQWKWIKYSVWYTFQKLNETYIISFEAYLILIVPHSCWCICIEPYKVAHTEEYIQYVQGGLQSLIHWQKRLWKIPWNDENCGVDWSWCQLERGEGEGVGANSRDSCCHPHL